MKILGIKRRRQILSAPELIDKYIAGTITNKEHSYLDWWVGNDPRNMKIFEEMTESISQKERPKDKTAGHREKAKTIATLLAGYMRKNLSQDDLCELHEWAGASDKNHRLFNELTDPKRVQLALELFND
jgi:inactivated superfamily I helicase